MADFPPNPEDGELWLPSYIIHEISTSTTVTPAPTNSTPKNDIVFPPHLRRNNNPQSSKPNLVEICFGSFSTNNGAAAAPPAPVISFHKQVTPTTTLSLQGFEGRKSKAVVEKYRGTGTGVFLPRSMNIIVGGGGAKKPVEITGGTGVFLNHQVAVPCQRKKTSNKEGAASGSKKKKKC